MYFNQCIREPICAPFLPLRHKLTATSKDLTRELKGPIVCYGPCMQVSHFDELILTP